MDPTVSLTLQSPELISLKRPAELFVLIEAAKHNHTIEAQQDESTQTVAVSANITVLQKYKYLANKVISLNPENQPWPSESAPHEMQKYQEEVRQGDFTGNPLQFWGAQDVDRYRPVDRKMPKKLLLVDVDCGVDDAQALMMALAKSDVEILGITCVHGNTSLDNICRNVLRVLKMGNRLEEPLTASFFHGKDGLGDAPDPDAPGLELLQKEGAVEAMIRIATENEGQVCLVATAPLTNLALAVKLDPTFPSRLSGLCIMGGNMEGELLDRLLYKFDMSDVVLLDFKAITDSILLRFPFKARGNTTVCGEFNFAADPEAAYIVLNEYLCPTQIATWEFVCYNKLSWEFCEEWMDQDTEKARFMRRIFAYTMQAAKSSRCEKEAVSGPGFMSCDSYAMAAAVDDTFVTESQKCAVSVELTGTMTRGMMVVDNIGLLKKDHKVSLMKKCDLEKFKKLMMDALK
ncbi:IUNH hydrolase, partial [Polypterus senegalus]